MSQTAYLPGEAVEAFYFGAPDNSLFGIYHLPVPGAARDCAVVLCPPIEPEYIRCHRAYRQLAVRLARAGFPVLRFDYSGTGDSAGEAAVEGLSAWAADVGTAADEAKKRSRLDKVILVGLRLGAALAAAAASGRSDITGLALWEPVVNGTAYVEELRAWHQDKLWYFLSDVQTEELGEPDELLGLALTPTMYSNLRGSDMLTQQLTPGQKVFIVESETEETVQHLRSQLESSSMDVQYQQVEGLRVWSDDPDKALVPHQVLQAIVTWVSGVCV